MRTRVPTTAQIRAAIDSGETGEKVAAQDPAAAPLGTDDEAAGHAPSFVERAMTAASLPQRPPHRYDLGFVLYLAISLTVAVSFLAIVFLASAGRG